MLKLNYPFAFEFKGREMKKVIWFKLKSVALQGLNSFWEELATLKGLLLYRGLFCRGRTVVI
jgi:hypothetical protein